MVEDHELTMRRPLVPLFLFAGALVAAALAIAAARAQAFAFFEPRMDHAMFTQWVARLMHAPRLLPEVAPGQSLLAAMIADPDNALSVLARQIFTAQTMLFTVVAVAFHALAGLALGFSMPGQIAVSVLAASLAIAVLGLAPALHRPGDLRLLAVGAGGAALMAGSSFLAVFGAMGPHNAGVLALMAAMIATGRWIETNDRRCFWVMAVIQALAMYTHYTNVFLIPTMTGLGLMLAGRMRMRMTVPYAAWMGVLALPIVALVIGARLAGVSAEGGNQDVASMTSWAFSLGNEYGLLGGIVHRAGEWVGATTGTLSAPGVALGLVGLLWLWRAHELVLPLALTAAHFLVGILLPAFSQFDRTIAYVLPMLCLGMAASVAAVASLRQWGPRLPAVAGIAVVSALVAHALAELPRLADPTRIHFWRGQVVHSGAWREVFERLGPWLPDGAMLVPGDYHISHVARSLNEDRVFSNLTVAPPLEQLATHQKAGELVRYLERWPAVARRAPGPVVVLAHSALDSASIGRWVAPLVGRPEPIVHRLFAAEAGIPDHGPLAAWLVE